MTPESYNTLLGVVRTLRSSLKSSHEIFIAEMGAKKPGDIKEICNLVDPKYGLLTSVGPQHLETFKSLDNIIKTKFELIDSLPKDGIAFLNFDNNNIKKQNIYENTIKYGVQSENLNCWASNIEYDQKGLNFEVNSNQDTKFSVTTKLLGMHNVVNIIGAISVALELGVPINSIQHAVKQVKPIPHRLELKTLDDGAIIIDNAFNSNPEGAIESVNVLSMFKEREKILITPGIIELGEKEYEYNYKFGQKAADVCDYIILVGKKRSKPIADGINNKNFNHKKLFIVRNLKEALTKMKEIQTNKSVILFENDLPDNYEE
jgi:UDP-N-acetylmuramoyl-tripeptide--D-alanyl-D-alanine ligase